MGIGTISIFVGVVLLIFLKLLVKDKSADTHTRLFHGIDHDEHFKEDLEYDPSWSTLSSNTHYANDE